MFLGLGHHLLAALLYPLVDNVICALTVQLQLSVLSKYDRHALSHVIEVENTEQLVDLAFAHGVDGDTVGRSFPEDEAEVPSCRDKSSFVRRLCLVLEVTSFVLGHHRVTQRQKTEEAVHVLVVATNCLQ